MSSSAIAISLPKLASANHESNNLAQGYDDLTSDFFDQFLTFDSIATTDHESPDYSILPTHFDDGPIDGGLSGAALPSLLDDELIKDSASAQGDAAVLLDSAASFDIELSGDFYAEESVRAALSDPELLSLENISLDSPQALQLSQTSPSSPSMNVGSFSVKKNRIVEPVAKTFKRATLSVDRTLSRSPTKKATSSKMLRMHQSLHSQEFWERNLSQDSAILDFDFDLADLDLPFSSPLSISEAVESSTSAERMSDASDIFTEEVAVPATITYLGYNTGMVTPTIEQQRAPRESYQVSSSSPFPVAPRTQNAIGPWSRIPSSSSFQSCSDSKAHAIEGMDDPAWWDHAAAATMAQSSPSSYYANSQRATKSLIGAQLQDDLNFSTNEMAFDPLNLSSEDMIHMPGVSSNQLGSPFGMGGRGSGGSLPQRQDYFPSRQLEPREHHGRDRQQFHTRARQVHSFPQSHPRPRHSMSSLQTSHSQSYQRPPQLRKSRSHPMHRSPSQQYIQNHHQSHFHSQLHPQHQTSDSDSPCPSPSIQVRKRKSTKNKQRGSGAGGAVDFVNYTPSDSRKILTGVAPSGSSKTKARREKEALDKRRKLSQAAVRAVRAAGGDVESLVEQGLFC